MLVFENLVLFCVLMKMFVGFVAKYEIILTFFYEIGSVFDRFFSFCCGKREVNIVMNKNNQQAAYGKITKNKITSKCSANKTRKCFNKSKR